jgi:hypothetical protein
MINGISVLNTVQDNGADVSVSSFGQLNMTGLPSVVASNVVGVEKKVAYAVQLGKSLLTFSAVASTNYSFMLQGCSMVTGQYKEVPISYTSGASTSTAIISAAITALINDVTDFNVVATDNGSGVVALTGKASTDIAFNAPVFYIKESDSNIAVTAPLTVSFSAAPTGGRTAQGQCVVSDAGALTSIIITDGGEGYITAPTATFAGGAGSSAAATVAIFEGSVVSLAAAVTAGSGYTCRQGWVSQGTQRAIYRKYQYNQPNATNGTLVSYPVLSNVNAAYSYDEWIISVNEFPKGGNTTVSSPTVTAQYSILVYTAATNVATLNSFWGSLNNLAKGYKSVMNDSGASNTAALTAATGAIAYTAGGSPAFGAVSLGIMPNDIIVIGTGVVPSASAGGVSRIVSTTSNTAGLGAFGGGTAATNVTADVFKHVKRRPIAL